MQPYSLDLRQRMITALEDGQPVAMVAVRFVVSARTVYRYRQQWQATETLQPRPIPGRPRLLTSEQERDLRSQVAAHPDARLVEHARLWARQTGQHLSLATLCRALQRLALPLKKSA